MQRSCLESEPDTSTVYVNKNRIYTVATGPAVTGLRVLCGYSDYFWDSVYTLQSQERLASTE